MLKPAPLLGLRVFLYILMNFFLLFSLRIKYIYLYLNMSNKQKHEKMKTISKLLKEKGFEAKTEYKIYKEWKKLNNSTMRCTTWLNLPAEKLNKELLEKPSKKPKSKNITQPTKNTKPIKFKVEYLTPNGDLEIKFFDIVASAFALGAFNKLMENHGYDVLKMKPVKI